MNHYSILKTITTGVFIVLSSTISAQEKTSKIETSPEVKTLIERKIEINKTVFENQYYAIQLYYGNNTAANRILEEFKVNFPEWEAELSFETPNYKVRVGRFKDLNIANQKLEEIRRVYPSAFLLEPNNL
jgi:hypothetical protein